MVSNFFELTKKIAGKTIKEAMEVVEELIVTYGYRREKFLIAYKNEDIHLINHVTLSEDVQINESKIYISGEDDYILSVNKEVKTIEFEEIDELLYIKFSEEEEITFGF